LDSWEDCKKVVDGVENARYKGFKAPEDAKEWLETGANYSFKTRKEFESGVYFDAETGSGKGVEISVTDERGNSLLSEVLPPAHINRRGKHWIFRDVTNNYGELLACRYALEIANKQKVPKKIFGDSELVIKFWSRDLIKRRRLPKETVDLSQEVAKLRKEFEDKGGQILYLPGDENPADLGFHR